MYTPRADDPDGRTQLNVRIDVALLRALKIAAAKRGQSVSAIVHACVERWLRNQEI